MSIHFAGTYTGIDTDALVESMMTANRVPLTRLENRKTERQQEKQAVSDLESRMANLEDLVEKLSDISNLQYVTGISSDDDVVGALASSGASEGSYALEINQLAAAEKEVHKGVATMETALGGGDFVYTYGGATRTLQTAADDTLADLRDQINDDAGNPGVTASILEYDDGEGGVYHLVLTGQETGADHTITIEAATTIADFGPGGGNWTETQAARNAQIRVDGYPAGEWIEKSYNSITDVIPNVTLNLYAPGTATVTLARNTGSLKTDLNNLVSIYNGIVDKMDEYTGYDEDTGVGGIMQGDSTLHGVVSQVRATLVGSVAGFVDGEDSFSLVSDIGLEIDRDGYLSLDEAKLDTAIGEDYMGVLKLIGAAEIGATDNAGLQFDSAYQTQAGVYDVEVDYDATGEITDARIKLQDETTWRSLTVDGSSLSGVLGNPEQGLELTVLSGGVSETIAYEVRVYQGFAGAAHDRLEDIVDPVDGAYKTKRDQIDAAIDLLDEQILWQETRLAKVEERLQEKFARMEQTLAEIDGLNAAFQSLFQMLEQNNAQTSTAG